MSFDPILLEKLRARDAETLSAVVSEHARPLYRMALSMGFSEPECEDLVQEVFTTFLKTLDRYEGRSQMRTWLFGILHHKFRECRRALQREETFDPIDDEFDRTFTPYGHWIQPPADLERLLASKEIGRLLDECLEGLPLQQREVFLLREVEGLESQEICNNLQVSVTHLGVLLHRARHRLRECLKGKGL